MNEFDIKVGNETGKRIPGRVTTVLNANKYYPKFVKKNDGYEIIVSRNDFENYEDTDKLFEPTEYRFSVKNPYLVTKEKVFYLSRNSLFLDDQENIFWDNEALFFYDDDVTFGDVVTWDDESVQFEDEDVDFTEG